MTVDPGWIQAAELCSADSRGRLSPHGICGSSRKKAGTKRLVPASELAGCPDKIVSCAELNTSAQTVLNLSYALLRGRTVKSRTWVRMLDKIGRASCRERV